MSLNFCRIDEFMDAEILESYIKAGKAVSAVMNKSQEFIKEDMLLVDIAEKIENMIQEHGAMPGCPVNLSLNNKAAHFTPAKNDSTVFKKGDMLKIDITAHIDGYIADGSYTLCSDANQKKLLDASKKALDAVIEMCMPGAKLSKISAMIEEVIKGEGYKPIENLTGHGLDRFDLHAIPQVPNVSFNGDYLLEEDQVIAIEPFATNGDGRIRDTEEVMIFSFSELNPVRNMDARKIIDFVQQYNGMPFAQRWIETGLNMNEFKTKIALRELVKNGVINTYPVLVEKKGSMVSQHEHSVIVRDDPVVLTK
ncbi:MAG: type II methionyl aminopeptidase [Candidatus Aenigmarchaeota archaeon]|nr:type II methionyl aminopeptidase [Candidatus Aenigmarchaeota archaeon]